MLRTSAGKAVFGIIVGGALYGLFAAKKVGDQILDACRWGR